MAMAVAINTPWMALDLIPAMQRELDRVIGDRGRFHIHRVSVYATILFHDPDIRRQVYSSGDRAIISRYSNAKQEALDWQADPDDDLGDAAVFHHLQQQAASVPLLSSAFSQSNRGNAATTLTGSALSASINAATQDASGFIVWAGPKRTNQIVFSQMQVDVVDLFSRRLSTPRPSKRQRTAFNQFMQLSQSPGIEHTSAANPLPHAKTFKGVRYRPDRKIWVAEMKPHKHKTKQDFGNFKSEEEAARAVDAAFHHYGRPDLLNFPRTSLQFLSTRLAAPVGLDEKAKVKFVKEEAKLLLAAIVASTPLRSSHANSLPIQDLSASPRRCPSGSYRSLTEISSPLSWSGPDEVNDAVSQPQPRTLLDSICDISTTGLLTNLETLNSVQNGEQGWDWVEDSCTLAAPPNVVNPSDFENPIMWLDSIIRSSPAPTYPRSLSPNHFQEEIAYALLEHQSI